MNLWEYLIKILYFISGEIKAKRFEMLWLKLTLGDTDQNPDHLSSIWVTTEISLFIQSHPWLPQQICQPIPNAFAHGWVSGWGFEIPETLLLDDRMQNS